MPCHKQQKFHLIWFISIVMLLGMNASYANTPTPPDDVLKLVADKMISELNNNNLKGKPEKVQALVEEVLLPSVDIINGSKLVLGKYWRNASTAQKIGFIKQFRSLLLRFYSSALAEYLNNNNEPLDRKMIKFLPRSEERRVGKECRSRWSPYL